MNNSNSNTVIAKIPSSEKIIPLRSQVFYNGIKLHFTHLKRAL
jgi:hypothetical protein